MILTENDLVCFVEDLEDEEFSVKDYLELKENVISKAFLYYSVENDKSIKVVANIENSTNEKIGINPFFNNLVLSAPLNLVDNIHGVMRDCYVNNMEFISFFKEAPEVHINAYATYIDPWENELDIDCYNIVDKHKGLLSNKRVNVFGQDSIVIKNVYISEDLYNIAEIVQTIGYNIKINRNGIVDIKQMFYFDRTIKNPGSPEILNNLKSRIMFGKNLESNNKDYNLDVKIGVFRFYIKDIVIDHINHVFDIIDLPNGVNINNNIVYRLYYHGRLVIP